tara:strand:+ start:106 stop:603 length:498 start_codon:yes stop_codon:yes gene_type:complete
MASVQSDNGWTKTNLGDGWTKLSEVCDIFTTGGTDDVKTTAITNTTANAVTDGPSMPIINELKAAGSFMVEVVLGAGTAVVDTHVYCKNSIGGTYHSVESDIIVDQAQSTTAMGGYHGAISDGLKIVVHKDSGTAANPVTVNLIYYTGGPNMSDVTIAGIGSDPS